MNILGDKFAGKFETKPLLIISDILDAEAKTIEVNISPYNVLYIRFRNSARAKIKTVGDSSGNLLIVIDGTPRALMATAVIQSIIDSKHRLLVVFEYGTPADYVRNVADRLNKQTKQKRESRKANAGMRGAAGVKRGAAGVSS